MPLHSLLTSLTFTRGSAMSVNQRRRGRIWLMSPVARVCMCAFEPTLYIQSVGVGGLAAISGVRGLSPDDGGSGAQEQQ